MLIWSLLACNGGADPWAETTAPYDPECPRCELVGVFGSGHIGDAEVYVDESLDDPAAQWSVCVEEIVDCTAPDPTKLAECVSSATCPSVCQKAFDKEGGDIDAFEAVFLLPDGACTGEGL